MTASLNPLRWPSGLLALALVPLPPARRALWIGVCAALVVFIGIADFVAGADLSLSILYLVPIFAATWIADRRMGLAMALLSAGAWFAYDHAVGQLYPHPLFQLWEGAIRLITWIVFVYLLAGLKAALQRADERFLTVLDGLDAAVYVVDPARGDILFSNRCCRALFAGQGQLTQAAQIEARLRPAVAGQLTGGVVAPPGEFEDPVEHRWYLIYGRMLRWVDGRHARLQVATDITGRKQAEDTARRQQEKTEVMARLITIGELASTIAHELNQPLAAIANYVEGCLRRLPATDAADLRDAMEKAHAQALRASAVIQRVRSMAGRRTLQLAECHVADVIRNLEPLIAADAARHDVRVELAVDEALPGVQADAVMLEQVLLNLCRNAFESMSGIRPEGRVMTLSARATDEGAVEIAVSDRGHGIPPGRAGNLFEAFVSTKANGVGLGLHVCRSVAELHGAHLSTEPNPKGGTIFRFRFPRGAPT
jgi:signal transduction histidine kinase